MTLREAVKEIEVRTDQQEKIINLAKKWALEMVGEDQKQPTMPDYGPDGPGNDDVEAYNDQCISIRQENDLKQEIRQRIEEVTK